MINNINKIIENAELYNEILGNDSFLNDLFTSLGATDKVSILRTAGFDLEKEFAKWNEEFQVKHEEPQKEHLEL